MGQGRQYAVIDPSKGGKSAAFVLVLAMLASVGILGAAVFLAIKLADQAGRDEAPPPPPPVPIPQFKVELTSDIQMALLFLEAQKSGNLPRSYPFTWRNDSGLRDGFDQNRNLTGGFYDGGGTIKYTFPMAFSVTMLSWSVIEYMAQYTAVNQLVEAVSLIQWGVDYLLAANYQNIIFAQVGVTEIDQTCWVRPEDMTSAQRPTMYPCDATHPCSDLAGEMAAALAAASIIFRQPDGNPAYADQVVKVAENLFQFADTYRGSYSDWVVESRAEYKSSGYTDELFWAAAWLYYATGKPMYESFILNAENIQVYLEDPFSKAEIFNWDKKSPGVQVLLTRLLTMGYGIDQATNSSSPAAQLGVYMNTAKSFVCQFVPQNTLKANFTRSGQLMWAANRNATLARPLEYSINTAFLSLLLVDYLTPAATTNGSTPGATYSNCNANLLDITNFVISQKNYVLGQNPMNMSYMVGYVGYGDKYPQRVYHKGASVPSYMLDDTQYTCLTGNQWLESPYANPNLLLGAVVGGPDRNDTYFDNRLRRGQSEPKTHINAVWAGLLAGLSSPVRPGISDYSKIWVNLPFAARKASLIQARLPKPSPPPPAPPANPPPWTPPAPGTFPPPYTVPPPVGPRAPATSTVPPPFTIPPPAV